MFELHYNFSESFHNPAYYVMPGEDLVQAVNMAILLGKPLLLTGEPGTGKTELAAKVAHELSLKTSGELNGFAPFLPTPFIFNTKTTSAASDLFYYYDAVRHFQSRAINESIEKKLSGNPENFEKQEYLPVPLTAHPYIQLNALGKAILQSIGKKSVLEDNNLKDLALLHRFHEDIYESPHSSVVLIDEVDKAPRDFPNDLLNELEYMEFKIQELNKDLKMQKNQVPYAAVVVILTSNFEKNLPDAFLRRCLFYHIASPERETLYTIVSSRMGAYLKEQGNGLTDDKLFRTKFVEVNKAVDEFLRLREKFSGKKPSTSELLEWIGILELHRFFDGTVDFTELKPEQKIILQYTLPILAKTKDDIEAMKKAYSLK